MRKIKLIRAADAIIELASELYPDDKKYSVVWVRKLIKGKVEKSTKNQHYHNALEILKKKYTF